MISVFHSCLLLFDVGCFSFLSVCRLFCCDLLLFCSLVVSFLIVGVCCCLLWFDVGLLSFLLRFAVVLSSVVDDAWSLESELMQLSGSCSGNSSKLTMREFQKGKKKYPQIQNLEHQQD